MTSLHGCGWFRFYISIMRICCVIAVKRRLNCEMCSTNLQGFLHGLPFGVKTPHLSLKSSIVAPAQPRPVYIQL